MLKFLFRSFNQCPSVINWWGQMTGLIFFRLPHTAKTWLVWSVTPGVSWGWGEVVADGRSGDVRAGGSLTITTFHLHLVAMSPLPAPCPPPPQVVRSRPWGGCELQMVTFIICLHPGIKGKEPSMWRRVFCFRRYFTPSWTSVDAGKPTNTWQFQNVWIW